MELFFFFSLAGKKNKKKLKNSMNLPNRNLINVSSVVEQSCWIVRWELSMCHSNLAPEPPEI